MVEAGERFGSAAAPERILVEFVSAGRPRSDHRRQRPYAAYGDSLCRILSFAGHAVEREYYVNDHGTQVLLFGQSIGARARGEDRPRTATWVPYVAELADRIDGAAETPQEELAQAEVALMVSDIRATLERFRVSFDRFFSERAMYEEAGLEREIDRLAERAQLYDSDDAVCSAPPSATTRTGSCAAPRR